MNKIDFDVKLDENDERLTDVSSNIVKISALNSIGIEKIYNVIENMFNFNDINVDNEVMITNIRQKNLISQAIEQVDKAKDTIQAGMPLDIVSIFIREILEDLSKITGEVVTDDIIDEIFSKFCLGK